MKRLLLPALLLLLVGCNQCVTIDFGGDIPTCPRVEYPEHQVEYPTVNLEKAFRQRNWRGPEKEGSCVHATTVMALYWQNRLDEAKRWRATFGDGEYPESLAAKLDQEGIRYAYTSRQNDVAFLEWACNTRRGCGVTILGGAHMVFLVHLDGERAGILDNNQPDHIFWVPRETFLSEWRNSTSWAVAPVYSPSPPLPCS